MPNVHLEKQTDKQTNKKTVAAMAQNYWVNTSVSKDASRGSVPFR